MALTNTATFDPVDAGLTISVTLNASSGNDRVVVGFGTQERSTLNLATPTLDGNAPTGTIITQDNGTVRITCHYWLDADMPASSGAYDLVYSGPDTGAVIGAYYAEDAKQAVPADAQGEAATGTNPSFSVTADSGSTYFIASSFVSNGTYTAGTSQTIFISDAITTRDRQAEFKTADGNVEHTYSVSSAYASAAFAVEPAAVAASAVVSGTITASTTEGDIVAGGKVIRVTLTGATFKAAGTGPVGSTADTQAILDGLTGDGVE